MHFTHCFRLEQVCYPRRIPHHGLSYPDSAGFGAWQYHGRHPRGKLRAADTPGRGHPACCRLRRRKEVEQPKLARKGTMVQTAEEAKRIIGNKPLKERKAKHTK